MNIDRKTFVKEWVKDLRSGNYRQGTRCLRSESKILEYCCLGVACETGKRLGIIGAGFDSSAEQRGSQGLPGPWFAKIIGCSDPILFINRNKDNTCRFARCTNINDQLHLSFSEIADLLEKEFVAE